MVARFKDKAIVVDLDGTLVSVNTFSRFMLFSTLLLARRGLIAGASRIIASAVARKTRFISHSRLKHTVLGVTERLMTATDIEKFVDTLSKFIRPEVVALVDNYRRRGYTTLLATAAPSLYAAPLAARLGFDGCVATLSVDAAGEAWRENSREAKLDSVKVWLDDRHYTIGAVITDHHDDRLLVEHAADADIYLVGPSKKTLDAMSSVRYTLLDAR